MNLIRELIAKFRDLVKPNEKGHFHPERSPDDQDTLMSDEEKLDEAIAESFPASDSAGHISKSYEDKISHQI